MSAVAAESRLVLAVHWHMYVVEALALAQDEAMAWVHELVLSLVSA